LLVERAEIKLRLDAVIIQQGLGIAFFLLVSSQCYLVPTGRLTNKSKKLTAQDMVDMIRYGADRVNSFKEFNHFYSFDLLCSQVFRSKDSTITDEDIDLILSRGEQKTAQVRHFTKPDCSLLLHFLCE
jgi:SWI/SNF-related matrix-associated actin-dependent regulator of chromatin subfamily A member 5